MKKFLVYSGVILAILVLLYLGVSFWVLRSTYSHVAAKRQAIANSGEAVLITEYQADPIPDEQNAYHYLMLAATDLESFHEDFTDAFASYQLDRHLRSDQVEELAKVVDKYPQLFERLEQAAACEAYQSNVDYADGILVELDHVMQMRVCAWALSAKALVNSYRGDGDLALAQCETSLRLTNHLSGEPILISHLVNLACQGIAILSANHTLRVTDTTPAARQSLDDVLAQMDNRQSLIDAFKGERAFGLLTFQQMRDGTLGADEADAAGMRNIGLLSKVWLGQAYLNDDEAKYIDLMNKQIEVAELPRAEREKIMDPLWDELEDSGLRHVLSRLLLPALNASVDATDRQDASIRCLRVLLALEGTDVTSLSDVELPQATKTDPFSGNPLILRSVDDEWLIYSVGEDMTDDGGQVYDTRLDQGLGPLLDPLPADEDAVESDIP